MTLRALAMVDLKQQRTYGIKVQECATVYVYCICRIIWFDGGYYVGVSIQCNFLRAQT